MVFIWSSGWGPRRRRPRRGYGPAGYGRGYGYGPPPGYGYGQGYGYGPGYGRRNDSCLRDLLFLNTGCCLANAIGCGGDAFLVAPATARAVRRSDAGERGSRIAERMVAAVRVYQREVSPTKPPCCRFEPTCSAYAVEALERHGAARGAWLTCAGWLRCRPGGSRGADPVPA
ncbi:membrane protein insertion efficiency factor YidD [Blastococcus sp. TML/C7B]|uniref:membrane protein insertion efficiency factor YidD n=1 Tax=Blastococcus sp. TML/C7B TaxID=2798728 RepID=UPI00190C5122|nr:membrane protein insertion efficiency factor YidD [Blastococcus sp. TML/C7B]MBN1097327.1 membrane protein insertion efficiency factor YidD [Blastococcus sp. TML/C7B]